MYKEFGIKEEIFKAEEEFMSKGKPVLDIESYVAEHLAKQGYRKQSEVAKEIIDLANELYNAIDSELSVNGDFILGCKSAIKVLQTKIMERYGVWDVY